MKISKTRSRLEMLALFGGSALLLLAGILIALQFVQPAPPRSIRIATGSADGAYYRYAERYRQLLAEHGTAIEPTHRGADRDRCGGQRNATTGPASAP